MGQATDNDVARYFTKAKTKAYDMLTWVTHDVANKQPFGADEVVAVEAPDTWSSEALSFVVDRCLSSVPTTKGRETSLKQVIDRIVDTIVRQGVQEGYFDSTANAESLREELKYILATQRATFPVPVWRNIGIEGRVQQASSYFTLAVDDTLQSILQWYHDASMVVNGEANFGVNISAIRSSVESFGPHLEKAAGPLRFMQGVDCLTEAIAGDQDGREGNVASMNISHPDIETFIHHKTTEQEEHLLRSGALDADTDGKNGFSWQYQGMATAVHINDAFMQAVEEDLDWELKAVTTGKVERTVKARDLWRHLAEAAWKSADLGLHFESAIDTWHTTPVAGSVHAIGSGGANMTLDDSAYMLVTINLLKYLKDDLSFDIEAFKHTVELIYMAQEILVGCSEYPSSRIAKNAKSYRQLGLSYANLEGLLRAQELSYDSSEGRAQAAAITALMTGHGYATSAKWAHKIGPFAGYNKDREAMIRVLKLHREAVNTIDASMVAEDLLSAATQSWDEANELAELYGVRNAQLSLLAQSSAAKLMLMDSNASGAEYESRSVRRHMQPFDQLKVAAAVQPFLSGAAGQVLMVSDGTTIEEIEQLHMEAWKMGLKTVSVYRDNSDASPIPAKIEDVHDEVAVIDQLEPAETRFNNRIIFKGAVRRELPRVRASRTYRFELAGIDGYFTVGEFEDKTPGELFINVSKQGSTLSGVMDSFAIAISQGLQYGVPLKRYVKSFKGTSYAPSGMTDDEDIRTASSITDYIFCRLALDYLGLSDRLELGISDSETISTDQTRLLDIPTSEQRSVARDAAAPLCYNCGNQTQVAGNFYICPSCGSTTERS